MNKIFVLLSLFISQVAICQHCQKGDIKCDTVEEGKSLLLSNDIEGSTVDLSTKSENVDKPPCRNFDLSTLTKHSPSIFLAEAKGRLGNHLMAYTIIKALEATLGIQVCLFN